MVVAWRWLESDGASAGACSVADCGDCTSYINCMFLSSSERDGSNILLVANLGSVLEVSWKCLVLRTAKPLRQQNALISFLLYSLRLCNIPGPK
eukprot:scaffold34601_cov142-Skeletonema_dohrnii-CCMP3373.AAC.6